MKIEAYESLIDGFIEASIIFSWYLFFSTILIVCLFCITAIIDIAFLEGSWLYAIFVYGILPFSYTVTIPMTLVLYYTRKAKRIYRHSSDAIRLRDFWMGFATMVSLKSRSRDSSDINKWLEENMSYMHKELHDNRDFIFAAKSDAMAFKLRWYE